MAGKGAGIEGKRSGLWSEYARLIGEIRPKYAIVENVAALLVRGMSRVLGDLSEIGYDAEWQIISAQDVGAWHRRERVWIVAHPHQPGLQTAWAEIVAKRLEQYRTVGELWPTPNTGDGTRGARKPDGKRGLTLVECAVAGGQKCWPTPRAHKIGGYSSSGFSPTLEQAINLFPTPTVNGNYNKKGCSNTSGNGLATIIGLFPTPTSSEHKYRLNGNSQQSNCLESMARRGKLFPTPTKRNQGDCPSERLRRTPGLESTVKLLPTPTSRDWRSGCASEATMAKNSRPLNEVVNTKTPGKLSPDWVEALMGFPLGWTDLDKTDIDVTNRFPLAWLDGSWEDGIPRTTISTTGRVDRLKQLGNAVVPAIVELIGRAIIELEQEQPWNK